MRLMVRAGSAQNNHRGNAQKHRRRERREQDGCSCGGEPVEVEPRRFGAFGLVDGIVHPAAIDGIHLDRMLAENHAMQRRHFEGRREHRVRRWRDMLFEIERRAGRPAIQKGLARSDSPHRHEHREKDPRHPRADEIGSRDRARRRNNRGCGSSRKGEVPRLGRPPPRAEERETSERHQPAHDVHQFRPDEVAPQELHDRKGSPAHEHSRPRAPKPAPAAHRDDEPGRYQQRYERQLAPGHRAQKIRRDPGDGAERQDRRADRAIRHWGRVRDERQAGRVERREAQPHQECRRDRHRRAKPCRTLDERAERERDEQRLHPPIR